MKDTLIVTPSVRDFPYQFFETLADYADHLVIDDSNGAVDRSLLERRQGVTVANNRSISNYFDGPVPWLIPSRTPSCKNFGLYYAYKEGYKQVILLDDDVDTSYSNFANWNPVGKEIWALGFETRSGWLNTLAMLLGRNCLLYPRGFPYEFREENQDWMQEKQVRSTFNMGLWTRVPDINGIDKLELTRDIPSDFHPLERMPWFVPEGVTTFPAYVYLRPGQHLPLSIMNVQLETRLIPAFWQPPDYPVYRTFRVRRHDDIWSMYFLKTIMDRLGDVVTVGLPMVRHMKAGDVYSEILSEHMTNLIQPYLQRMIDHSPVAYPEGTSYKEAAIMLGESMLWELDHNDAYPETYKCILEAYTKGAIAWANLF